MFLFEISRMQKLKQILKVIFIIPFSIGNPDAQSSNATDGSVSAAILFSCLVSIILVVVGTFSGLHRFNETSMKVIWGLIATLVTIATINILLIFSRIHGRQNPITSMKDDRDASSQLQLKFLWLFGLGLILRTSLTIATNVDCFAKGGSQVVDVASAISSFVMIVFILLVIGLITFMKKRVFLRVSWIYFSIGAVLLANASVWLNFATVGIFGILHQSVYNNVSTNYTIRNNTFNYCFLHSEIRLFSTEIQPYLFQISLDFLLLATLFIVKTLPALQDPDINKSVRNVHEEIRSNILNHRRTGIVSIVIGIILHIPFFVMALVIRFVFLGNLNILREIWQIGVIVQKSVMLLIILAAFSHMGERSSDPCAWKFSSSDCILLTCCGGKIVVHTFEILVTTANRVLLCKGILNLVFYFYHTLYILVSRRSVQAALMQSRVSIFVHVLLFTLNITQWTTTAFVLSVEGNYVLNEGVEGLFPNPVVWKVLQYIIIPFTLYYDFQSAMHFYGILPNFRFETKAF